MAHDDLAAARAHVTLPPGGDQTMTAQELLSLGRLDESLAALQGEIRAKPEDARLRIFLFQLLCVLGRWDRALTQLNVLSQLDASSMMLANMSYLHRQCH